MNNRAFLYFALAALPSLMGPANMPASAWEWFKYGAMGLYQGLLAIKALQSLPPPGDDSGIPPARQQVALPGAPHEEQAPSQERESSVVQSIISAPGRLTKPPLSDLS